MTKERKQEIINTYKSHSGQRWPAGHFRHGAHSPGERPRGGGQHPKAGLQLQGGCGGRRLFGRFRELHPLPEH